MLPEIGLAKGACSLWQEDQFLDYTIEVEDEHFKVHKLVMASVSDYFRAMLTGGLKESKEDRVRLEGLSSLSVKNMIEYVYTGEFGSSKASAEECLVCAVYLQIPAAVKTCAAALCEEVDKKNCFRILSLFKTYAIKHGIEHTVNFMKRNFEDILEDLNSDELTYDEFLCLMECWRRTECQLFVRAMEWLKKDHENRKQHLNEIMIRLRFCLMSPTELALITSMKGMGIISDADGQWHGLVEKALTYHKLPIHQKVLDESEQAKVRTEPSPMCFGADPPVTGQVVAIREKNSWTRYNTVNPVLFTDDSMGSFIYINNFYIACINHGENDVECSVFDPRRLTWSAMAPMMVPRERCSLVYHEKHLYAFGGHVSHDASQTPTDIIEKYDFHTNTWSVIVSKMPVPRKDFGVFSIGACLYVPGDWQNEDEGDYSRMQHCFDPHTGEWSDKAASPAADGSNRVVVEIDGEQVIAYIDEDIMLHYYKPSVDQWLVYARSVPSRYKFIERECNLLATGNTIYLVNCCNVGGEVTTEVCEKWTFGENGLRIDVVTDGPRPEWCKGACISPFCALLAIP